MANWISVKEKLPNEGQEVIIFSEVGGGVDLCVYEKIKLPYTTYREETPEFQTTWTVPITHWIPNPKIKKHESESKSRNRSRN